MTQRRPVPLGRETAAADPDTFVKTGDPAPLAAVDDDDRGNAHRERHDEQPALQPLLTTRCCKHHRRCFCPPLMIHTSPRWRYRLKQGRPSMRCSSASRPCPQSSSASSVLWPGRRDRSRPLRVSSPTNLRSLIPSVFRTKEGCAARKETTDQAAPNRRPASFSTR